MLTFTVAINLNYSFAQESKFFLNTEALVIPFGNVESLTKYLEGS